MRLPYDLYGPSMTVNSAEYVCQNTRCKKFCIRIAEIPSLSYKTPFIWDTWDLPFLKIKKCSWTKILLMLHVWYQIRKIYWTNFENWIWVIIHDNWVGHYIVLFCAVFCFALSFCFNFWYRYILNDPQMAFSVLEFSKILYNYLPGDMEGGWVELVTNDP